MAPEPTATDDKLDSSSPEPETARQEPVRETTFLGYLREWSDALVIAFVVAMFIRMFVVELFKIPSGSMSPTLLGDWVAEGSATDSEGENHEYLLISDAYNTIQVFEKQPDSHYIYRGKQPASTLTSSQKVLLQSRLHREEHRILVNKFAYWFNSPERADVVIFRVPFKLDPQPTERDGIFGISPKYERNQSVYVKRAVALEGETLEIEDDGHLYINGQMVTKPEILSKLQYQAPPHVAHYEVKVPEDHVIALGDNSDNSLDSRFWGPLPEQNLRGKAVFTYWPFKNKKFLSPN